VSTIVEKRKESFYMRRPNGWGGIVYLGDKRRRPYAVRVCTGVNSITEKNGKKKYKMAYKYVGYFETKERAEKYLDDYIRQNEEVQRALESSVIENMPKPDTTPLSDEELRIRGIWHGMIDRCENPNNEAYKYYGAKGVSVCDTWLVSFKAFLNWSLSHGYMEGLSIDRIDPRGNYEPSNCRWTDSVVQAINKRAKHDDCYTCMFRNAYINNLHETCYERVMELREKNISEEKSESC
jgi:hypothetical protein